MNCPCAAQREIPTDRVFCTWCDAFVPAYEMGLRCGVIRRLLASLVDPVLVLLAWLVPAALLNALAGSAFGRAAEPWQFGVMVVGPVIVMVWYAVLFARGETFGKRLLGERVVDRRAGKAPGFWRMVGRETIGKAFSTLFFGLGLFWAIWDKDGQTWHDKLFGTVVVRRGSPLGAPVAPLSSPAAADTARSIPPAPAAQPVDAQRVTTGVVALLLLVVAGVGSWFAGTRHALRGAATRVEPLVAEVAALRTTAAQKDSILTELSVATRLISDINQRLDAVRDLRARPVARGERGGYPPAMRDEVLARIDDLAARLNDAEARLAARQREPARTGNDALQSQLRDYAQMIATFRETIARQRTELDALTGRVRTLEAERAELAAANTARSDSIVTLRESVNTVFYVASNRDELLSLGVIEETGGARLLGLGPRRGRTVQAARSLREADFTPLNLDVDTEIPLPRSDRTYRIVSRQDLTALAGESAKSGDVRGVLRIADPVAFWAPSRFLILMEK